MLLVLLFFPILSCVDDIWSEMGRRGGLGFGEKVP